MAELSDDQLLRDARRRPEAIGEFYDRHEATVLAYFLRRCSSPETALDLTAETFAEVVLQCHRGVEVREPVGWLFAIAQAKLAIFYRRGAIDQRARRRMGIGRLDADDEQLERIEALLDEPRAVPLLDHLPDDEREAVLARVVQERPYSEIAADHQTTEQVIRKRVSRALARLRRGLTEAP